MVTQRVPFGELNQSQRNIAYREVNQERREYPSRRFFVSPSLSCGLRHPTPCRRCLCFVTVPFGVRNGPFQGARFGSKLSESLVAAGQGVNRPFPFGVLVFNRETRSVQLTNAGPPIDVTRNDIEDCNPHKNCLYASFDAMKWRCPMKVYPRSLETTR